MCAVVNEQKDDIKKYVKQLIALELEIKSIKEDMKQIKQEAKENGILIKEIDEAIRELKKEIKRRSKPNEADAVETIKALIESDEDLYNSLTMIV
jgi:uncharacterized protein (UPF0335 family)